MRCAVSVSARSAKPPAVGNPAVWGIRLLGSPPTGKSRRGHHVHTRGVGGYGLRQAWLAQWIRSAPSQWQWIQRWMPELAEPCSSQWQWIQGCTIASAASSISQWQWIRCRAPACASGHPGSGYRVPLAPAPAGASGPPGFRSGSGYGSGWRGSGPEDLAVAVEKNIHCASHA